MSAEITVAEWLADLNRISAPSPDAMTVVQWAKKLGRPEVPTARWIRTGLESGWMERASMTIEELTGRRRRITGFRVVAKHKKVK